MEDFAADCHSLARLDRYDRLEPTAIFVAERESKQQILDRDQARSLEVCRFARADPLQKLQRQLQQIGRHVLILVVRLLNDDCAALVHIDSLNLRG